MISYYDKVLNEIKIMGILLNNNSKDKDADNANVVKIQELIYSNSHQFLYIITEYYDVGPIMNRDNIKYNHYHNPKLVECFDLNNSITLEYEDKVSDNGEENGLIKSQLLPLSFKHTMAKAIFKQIFAGIKYIHSKRIAHRDIKIENILFNSKDKKIKIIDYSISTILSNGETEINEPGGSMHYQAPELFSYDTKGYYEPFKADIWSIGICLYIFIYEQYPFDSDSELELQMKILNNDLYHPFNPDNESFLLLLNSLLDKNPMTRLTDYDKILEMKYFN